MVIPTFLSMLQYITGSDDRDFVDRLHSYYTTNLLLALAVLCSFKQFGGNPIECIILNDDILTSEQFVENYCWAEGTYFLNSTSFPELARPEDKKQKSINYYQWIPFLLLFQAACFRLPHLIWKQMCNYSGINVDQILNLSADPNNIKKEIKDQNVQAVDRHLRAALNLYERYRSHPSFLRRLNLAYTGKYVTFLYLAIKISSLTNIIVQLFVMNSFLQTKQYPMYGFTVFIELLSGRLSWEKSGLFPRTVLCDLTIRQMGNINNHTVQCVLSINIFNEKIFIMLWIWYLFLVFVTLGSIVQWTLTLLPCPTRNFLNRHLEMCETPFDPIAQRKEVRKFAEYLNWDGLLILRMVDLQCGVIFGTDLVSSMFISMNGEANLRRWNSEPQLIPAEANNKHGIKANNTAVNNDLNVNAEVRHRFF